jgi:hypothetical protein
LKQGCQVSLLQSRLSSESLERSFKSFQTQSAAGASRDTGLFNAKVESAQSKMGRLVLRSVPAPFGGRQSNCHLNWEGLKASSEC